MIDKPYLLDGKPVTFEQVIEAAQRYEDDGTEFYTTSQAAVVLRRNGHTVAENPDSTLFQK